MMDTPGIERRIGRVRVATSMTDPKHHEVMGLLFTRFLPFSVTLDRIRHENVYEGYSPEFRTLEGGTAPPEYRPVITRKEDHARYWHTLAFEEIVPAEKVAVAAPRLVASQSKEAPPPVDRTQRVLVSGAPVPEDNSHTQVKANGQHKDYVVLSEAERAKGFIRPVRRSYVHTGIRPQYPLRDLTPQEIELHKDEGWIKYEEYPKDGRSALGRYWSQKELTSGCGTLTTMGTALAETYARDPHFYGSTFCMGCGTHIDVKEFTWDGTAEKVGS